MRNISWKFDTFDKNKKVQDLYIKCTLHKGIFNFNAISYNILYKSRV